MDKVLNKKETDLIIKRLVDAYPNTKYYLNFNSLDELFVCVLLSPQTKDEIVNKITPKLFSKYKTFKDFSKAKESELVKYIKSINFAKNKAKNIINASFIIVNKYNGKIPDKMKELLELPGIGRKSANTILINAYNITEGIPVDTWVIKLSFRIGLSLDKNPDKIEEDLKKIIEKKYWGKISYILKEHGKKVCKSIPICSICIINDLCRKNNVVNSR